MVLPRLSAHTEILRCQRERRVWRTSRAGLVSQFISYFVRLAVVPLSLKLLGPERYGLWLTVGSLVAWVGMTEMGLARGMVNAIAEAVGRNDVQELRRLISTGFVAFGCISVFAGLAVIPASGSPIVLALLGVPSRGSLAGDARALILTCGLFFAASLWLHVVTSTFQGLQEGYIASYIDCGSSVVGLLALTAVYAFKGNLVHFAIAVAAPSLLINLALAGWMFTVHRPELRPSVHHASTASLRIVARFGAPLFIAQVANLAVLYSSNILVANALGPAEVPKFAVPNSLFMIAAGACMMLVQPYVPAIAEAAQRGDWLWIRRASSRNLLATLVLMTSANVALILAGRPIIRLWAGPELAPDWRFLLAMCVYYTVLAAMGSAGVVLVGLGRLVPRAVLHVAGAIAFVGAAWLLTPKLGVIAIPVAGSAAFAWVVVAWTLVAVRHVSSQCRCGHPEFRRHSEHT